MRHIIILLILQTVAIIVLIEDGCLNRYLSCQKTFFFSFFFLSNQTNDVLVAGRKKAMIVHQYRQGPVLAQSQVVQR